MVHSPSYTEYSNSFNEENTHKKRQIVQDLAVVIFIWIRGKLYEKTFETKQIQSVSHALIMTLTAEINIQELGRATTLQRQAF